MADDKFKLNDTKSYESDFVNQSFDPIRINSENLELAIMLKSLVCVFPIICNGTIILLKLYQRRKRLYFLCQLKRAKVGTKKLVLWPRHLCMRPKVELFAMLSLRPVLMNPG